MCQQIRKHGLSSSRKPALLHNTGTFEIKLSLNGVDRYNTNPRPTYTIEVDEGKAGSDPRKGIDGKNKAYVLEFKLNQAVLSVTEE